MKKILLCGATQGFNFGDSLFAIMFMNYIKNHYINSEVLFTHASKDSKNELSLKVARFTDILSADALVYISGGYFGESHNEKLKLSLYRFWTYFKVGLIMILRKKPIAIIGAGAGPIKNIFMRKIVVRIFNNAKIISVRDIESKKYMNDYGVLNDIIVTTDTAQVFYKREFEDTIIQPIKFDKLDNLIKVLIHLPSNKIKDIYNKCIIEAIQETLSKDDNIGFIVTYDSINNDDYYLEEVYNSLPSDRTIIYNYFNPIEFLKVLDSVDIIITPKLHVGILGASFDKAVLSFPSHPEKTTRYYKQIGYSEHCIPIYAMSKDDTKNKLKDLSTKNIKLSNEIIINSYKNFELLKLFIDSYVFK